MASVPASWRMRVSRSIPVSRQAAGYRGQCDGQLVEPAPPFGVQDLGEDRLAAVALVIADLGASRVVLLGLA